MAGIRQRWPEVERAMGIEYIARALRIFSNHGVTGADERCVRILCEKRRHTNQCQPMRPLGTDEMVGSVLFRVFLLFVACHSGKIYPL